jgi:hypothetical protein
MKSFLQFVREATEATINNDKQELVRQKKHLLDKAKEYKDQAEREESHGQGGGAARAKGEGFLDNAKNIKESTPAWQRSAGKDPEGGLNRKGIASYRAANPGSKLSMAVTTKPSKLKPGSKAANRRKSFCARMGGMKKRLTSAKTARDPDSRINKALRKWNCN